MPGDHTRQTLVSYDDAGNRTTTTLANGPITTGLHNKAADLHERSTECSTQALDRDVDFFLIGGRGKLNANLKHGSRRQTKLIM